MDQDELQRFKEKLAEAATSPVGTVSSKNQSSNSPSGASSSTTTNNGHIVPGFSSANVAKCH
eukprot:12915773-Prorocentrum_lima.AAC.1